MFVRTTLKGLYLSLRFIRRGFHKFVRVPCLKACFEKCGKGVNIGKGGSFSFSNISIGNDVAIGGNAQFIAGISKIRIGNKVMFGPHVFMISGAHRTDLIGKYMIDISEKEKLPENDKDITVQDDVWIGANAIILKGVTVGMGSVVAAGSVVTKDVEPYSIVAGVPAKKIRDRFSKEDLEKHLELIGMADL